VPLVACASLWFPLTGRRLGKIAEWVKARDGAAVIPFSVVFEAKVAAMDEAAREAYFKETGAVSMVPKIIKTGYSTLHLVRFFTAGADEVRAWTIHVR
jgi:ribosome-binding ATPase YchF (GTP1/OBG family)